MKKFFSRHKHHNSLKLCRYPGCHTVTDQGYCSRHASTIETASRSQWYYEVAKPFYDSNDWRRCRNAKLLQIPYCEHHHRDGKYVPATEVDHIIPISVDWSLRLDITNLQSLCKPCHSRKTLTDNKLYFRT